MDLKALRKFLLKKQYITGLYAQLMNAKSKAGYHTYLQINEIISVIMIMLYTHKKSLNLSTRCVRNRLVASLSTSCNNAVILSSCYKVVTHNLLTNCRAQQPCSKLPSSYFEEQTEYSFECKMISGCLDKNIA
jgi:hypothetical protein